MKTRKSNTCLPVLDDDTSLDFRITLHTLRHVLFHSTWTEKSAGSTKSGSLGHFTVFNIYEKVSSSDLPLRTQEMRAGAQHTETRPYKTRKQGSASLRWTESHLQHIVVYLCGWIIFTQMHVIASVFVCKTSFVKHHRGTYIATMSVNIKYLKLFHLLGYYAA